MKPKELRIAPDELFFDGQIEFNERTVLRNWMSQWLKWVHWYYAVAMSENVTLEDFLQAPICATTWKRTQRAEGLVMFGHMWKLYDMAAGWSTSTTPPYVFDPATQLEFPFWLLWC